MVAGVTLGVLAVALWKNVVEAPIVAAGKGTEDPGNVHPELGGAVGAVPANAEEDVEGAEAEAEDAIDRTLFSKIVSLSVIRSAGEPPLEVVAWYKVENPLIMCFSWPIPADNCFFTSVSMIPEKDDVV